MKTGGMVELVDTADLKSVGLQPCRFDSGYRHQSIGEETYASFAIRG